MVRWRSAPQLQGAEQQTAQTRRTLALVVQEADIGIVTATAMRQIVVFNRAAERMFGLSAADMLGKTLDELPLVHSSAHPDPWLPSAAPQQFEDESAPTRPSSTLQVKRADGSDCVVELVVTTLTDNGSTLLIAVFKDMTRERALEAERRSRETAEAANRAKSAQVGVVSHELRTPLNAVIGLSGLILAKEPGVVHPELLRWVSLIQEAGKHMLRVIGDLTELSRLEAGQDPLEIRPVDLAPMLATLQGLLAPAAQQANVSVALSHPLPHGAAWVLADERRLRQVVLNVVGNAIKYNRPGGQVQLIVQAPAAGCISLSVRDTGIGISSEQLAHLYEPFNRLGRQHTGIEGTGLGLAVSRLLVLAMNGQLAVNSTLGQGTEFTITVPVAAQGDHPR
jgi:PAS domain S-box-containing protein